jgi:probable HAF family extracellular repeat protein
MRDLNNLVSGSSLTLVDSGKINDQGQVVGLAFTNNGELHGFLASPDNDDSVDTEASAAIRASQTRQGLALPEVVQKMLERQMFHKSRHLGRSVRLKNPR